MAANLLPLKTDIAYSQAEMSFFKIWIQVAIVIGLLLPVIAILGYSREIESRGMLPFHPSLPKPCLRFSPHTATQCAIPLSLTDF